MIDATSADRGRAERWVVAVASLADKLGRVEEGAAEEVDGFAPEAEAEAESDVGVDGGGDAGVGVAQEFLDDDEFDAQFQEQGGGRVPDVVTADAA